MTDFTTFKVVENSFEIEQVQFQNKNLRQTNGSLLIILTVTLLFVATYHYYDTENKKNYIYIK
ncbi:MAG: hypothetical protein V4548_12225 [Bacteroidota bacterium]